MTQDFSYSRETTAISELTGRPVKTWSEEWRHECEARTVLAMPKAQRDAYFSGVKGENSQKGIVELRGREAAEALWATMRQLQEIRDTKKQTNLNTSRKLF